MSTGAEPTAAERARDYWERRQGRAPLIVVPGSAEDRARKRFKPLFTPPPQDAA